VHSIEILRLLLRQVHHAGGDNEKTCLFETAVDFPDQVLLYAIGFDNGERLLNGHTGIPSV
jgi:hypothetical protein